MNIGSIWHRWDLHYHTPSSYDYKNKAKTNEVLVQELLDDGVSGVAVTDHHVIDFGRINSLNTTSLSSSVDCGEQPVIRYASNCFCICAFFHSSFL